MRTYLLEARVIGDGKHANQQLFVLELVVKGKYSIITFHL